MIKPEDYPDYTSYMQAYRAILKAWTEGLKAPKRQPRKPRPAPPDEHQAKTAGRSKLTEDDVRSLRSRHAAGETGTALAADFGITPQAANRIAARTRWAHVPD